jgi:SOS-response transcriptional repressor LexA
MRPPDPTLLSPVLDAITRLTHRQGYPPSVEELRVELDYATVSAVTYHLNRLRDLGHVTWQPRKARTLKVVGEVQR